MLNVKKKRVMETIKTMTTEKTIKKVYFFYIINNEVDIDKEYDPYSGSNDAYLTVFGPAIIHASENYFTIEEALDARDNEEKENGKYYTYTPVMEGWIRE
jgi:hypothetical protein